MKLATTEGTFTISLPVIEFQQSSQALTGNISEQ